MRPETGPLKFGNDWTGCFIRGDQCFQLSLRLEQVLERNSVDSWAMVDLKQLLALLQSTREAKGQVIEVLQQLKPFDECMPWMEEGLKERLDKAEAILKWFVGGMRGHWNGWSVEASALAAEEYLRKVDGK